MTMAVVILSRMALRKKVTTPTSQIREESFDVLMRRVMTSKPLWASTTSTMVMAPTRKKTICAVPMTDSPSSAFSFCESPSARA